MKKEAFTEEEIKLFQPCEKIGLVASVNPDGLVHVTLISSIMAINPTQMTLGQFCMGRGKWFIQENNQLSFLIMTLDRRIWRGQALWTHKRFDGPEYEVYNEMPMFRYNTYFGVNTVHYLDLVERGDEEPLPLAKIIPAALMTRLAKNGMKSKVEDRILKAFAENLFNKLSSLKFLAFLGENGFPTIIPLIQCQAADSRRLAFSTFAYADELKALKAGANVAVYCCNLDMQSVLIRGTFNGYHRQKLMEMGAIDIEWVYNSMPPIHEQIYPEIDLKAVVNF